MHIAALFVFPLLGGFICLCTHTCISFLFGLEWELVGHILLTIISMFTLYNIVFDIICSVVVCMNFLGTHMASLVFFGKLSVTKILIFMVQN
jgi:hypothetical protein